MLNIFKKNEKQLSEEEILVRWKQDGYPLPPPHIVKQKAIREYQVKYALKILVETGTYLGDMVEAQLNNFSKIISIELSENLYKKAKKKFRNETKVELLQGDSGKKLAEVVPALNEPALFWLDGHYSGGITALGDKECPVPEELSIILKTNQTHIILIDDARMFNGTQSYPTIQQIEEMVKASNRHYSLEIKDDIIRLTPLQ